MLIPSPALPKLLKLQFGKTLMWEQEYIQRRNTKSYLAPTFLAWDIDMGPKYLHEVVRNHYDLTECHILSPFPKLTPISIHPWTLNIFLFSFFNVP